MNCTNCGEIHGCSCRPARDINDIVIHNNVVFHPFQHKALLDWLDKEVDWKNKNLWSTRERAKYEKIRELIKGAA